MSGTPETRYARSSSEYVAYQVWGEGPDLIACASAWGVDTMWEHPHNARILERLGRFSRCIFFDCRGTGSSTRSTGGRRLVGLDVWMEDVGAVLRAAGSDRANLLGISEGAATAAMFAATNPSRVSSLVIVNGAVRFLRSADFPAGLRAEDLPRYAASIEADWGVEPRLALAPSMAGDESWCRWWQRAHRLTQAPDEAAATWSAIVSTDVHQVLPAIQAPTLILHRRGNRHARIEHGRYLAEHIPAATLRELEGEDHMFFAGDVDGVTDEIEEFITGSRPAAPTNRVLLTVLFTDIVESSTTAARLGDQRWRTVLDRHDRVVREQLARHAGIEVNTTGDGFVATFDGPARAVRCAQDLVDAVEPLGLAVRAGVHTGEVELRGADIGGIAVHTAARVQSLADPGEVLVSRTVTDLVAGSGLEFVDRGSHELRGIPGRWQIFGVARS